MGYVTIGVLGLTALVLIASVLFGVIRGARRSILRLILILVCGVGAFLLRNVVKDLLLNLQIEGESFSQVLMSTLGELPESLANLFNSLFDVLFVLIVYLLVFYALRFVTWILVYPFLKLIIRATERKKDIISKKRGLGALFGLLQGLLIIIMAVAPISGMVSSVDRFVQLNFGTEEGLLDEATEEKLNSIGLIGYHDSTVGSIYDKVGGWYLDIVSSTTREDGTKTSLPKMTTTIENTVEVIAVFGSSKDLVETITAEETSEEDRTKALKDFGAKVKEAGDKAKELGENEQTLLNDLAGIAVEIVGGSSGEETVALVGEGADLTAAGQAIIDIGNYYETESIEDEKVAEIVQGFAKNPIMIDILGGQVIEKVAEGDKAKFEEEINKTNLSAERKQKLKVMFGLVAAGGEGA